MCVNSQSENLNRLIRYLTINNVNVINSGLYHGKIGIAICFCEYARYLKDELYLDLAGELLDEVFDEINNDTSFNFENGICGIGWGVEYLIHQKFMAGDTDDILEAIDVQVMQTDISRITDYSIETGLGGIAAYVIARITAKDRTKDNLPFDLCYLENWMQLLPIWQSKKNHQEPVSELFAKLLDTLHGLPYVHKEILEFPTFIPLGNLKEVDLSYLRLLPKGLEHGIAGMALQIMRL